MCHFMIITCSCLFSAHRIYITMKKNNILSYIVNTLNYIYINIIICHFNLSICQFVKVVLIVGEHNDAIVSLYRLGHDCMLQKRHVDPI